MTLNEIIADLDKIAELGRKGDADTLVWRIYERVQHSGEPLATEIRAAIDEFYLAAESWMVEHERGWSEDEEALEDM